MKVEREGRAGNQTQLSASATEVAAAEQIKFVSFFSPAGCSAFTGGLVRVMMATPSESTRYWAVGPEDMAAQVWSRQRWQQMMVSTGCSV